MGNGGNAEGSFGKARHAHRHGGMPRLEKESQQWCVQVVAGMVVQVRELQPVQEGGMGGWEGQAGQAGGQCCRLPSKEPPQHDERA